MKINTNNYELFFVDYYDGNLDDTQIEQLLHFLKDHSELEEEFYAFENISTYNDNLASFNKPASLLKTVNDLPEINARNFDEFCVAYIEEDLNAQNKAKFELFLAANEAYRLDFEKYKHTKLQPEIVAFPEKNKLKKYSGRVLFLRNAVRVAAAASLLTAGILFFRYDLQQEIMVAETPVQVDEVTYENKIEVLAEVTENKIPEKKTKKDDSKKISQSRKNVKADTDNKDENKNNLVPVKKTKAKSEKLKPVQKKGVFIVGNQWHKPLSPGNTQPAYDNDAELETLMAEAPDFRSDELTIDKVKDLLTNNKQIRDISVWELADMGLRSFGKLTESEYSVKPIIDSDGNLESVAFSTEKYTLFAPLRRNRH